jgi:hypothetical protein
MLRKVEGNPVYIYKLRFIIALLFAAFLLLLTSCSKPSANNPVLETYFVTNVLNRNFVVQYASDSGVDITSHFINDTFLLKTDTSLYNGPMTGSRAGVIYTGRWNSNSDYSKLDISITDPSTPEEFIFLNRSWRFTQKSIPIMQLAPWGTTDPKVLNMQRL